MSYNIIPEDSRYLVKMLVSEPNHAHAIIVRLDLFPIFGDPHNWEWKPEYRALWEPAEAHWQLFCAQWYGATESQSAFLVASSLSLEPLPPRFNPFVSSIFVRNSYVTMFDTVWAKAIASGGRNGVIITGQPGTGKTLFIYYLLVRLLQRKQVILFSPDGKRMFLFYDKEVYTVSMEMLASRAVPLPHPISSSNVFIWSLFDIWEPKQPESFLVTRPCFPVQIASPNPNRYKTWEKEQMPLLTGLPLWTHDELVQGLPYQDQYHSLLDALRKVYGSSSPSPSAPSIDPLAIYPGARALLEERYSEEDAAPPSPEDALDYLLDEAIDRFGHSARDVYGAVFNFSGMTRRHKDAFDLTYEQLRDAVSALSKNRSANYWISHRILALSPVDQGPFIGVDWDVDFKSDWISRNVLQKLGEAKDDEIHEQISFFQNISQERGLAGRLLEPFAHRHIANTTDGFWPLINMKSNATDAPLFTLDRDFPVQENVRFDKAQRELVKLQSIANLSTCLKHNAYYVPTDPNFPLFDAFIVEFDYANSSAILWVLQMTMSRTHEGSTRGYQKIREIIAILKDELREDSPQKRRKTAEGQATTPLVQVRFLLVVPKDESQSQNLQWQFPKGWSQNRKRNDHNGNVYCLEVPLAI